MTSHRLPALARALDTIERAWNRLPDPAAHFLALLLATFGLSCLLAPARRLAEPTKILNGFHPLGVVLVAILGVGVAEQPGLVDVVSRLRLGQRRRTPAIIPAGLLSHDGYSPTDAIVR